MPGQRPRATAAYQRHRRNLAKRRGFLTPEPERHALPGAPMSTKIKRTNIRYGHDLEDRAVEAFCDGEVPAWFLGIRPASHAEDQAGVDLWAMTDRGDIAVQVKSSAERARLFRESHPGMEVAIVVLHADMTDERIRARVIDAVLRVWLQRSDKKRRAA